MTERQQVLLDKGMQGPVFDSWLSACSPENLSLMSSSFTGPVSLSDPDVSKKLTSLITCRWKRESPGQEGE